MSDLIELKCRNCGSTDLKNENGVYICQACGCRFIPAPSLQAKANKYRDKMLHAMTSSNEDYRKPSDEDDLDATLRRYRELEKYNDRLLEILPEDPYGWACRVYLAISNGLDHEWNVSECVDCSKKALEYAQRYSNDEDKEDIGQFLADNLGLYRDKILANLISERDKTTFLNVLRDVRRMGYGDTCKVMFPEDE